MSDHLEVVFASLSATPEGTCVALTGQDLALGSAAQALNKKSDGALFKAAKAAEFKGNTKTAIELLAPAKLEVNRLIIVGTGRPESLSEHDWVLLGGFALGQIATRKTKVASLIAQVPDTGDQSPEHVAASLAFGAFLRNYAFKKYQTRKPRENGDKDNKNATSIAPLVRLVVHCANPKKARAAFAPLRALANGVYLARDLVNEPANVLGPVEFAEGARELERLGVEVEILDDDDLKALKMGSLLSVGKGSDRPTRLVVMQWHGANSKRAKPLAFIGKGVVFDTGGISIKAAQGMENMKGDMGGAACVTGLMHALAERKANVNAVGLIGLVENMPSGTATRPGDIVTSMSGQTIEVINTDAEGRLVLADVLWYAQERFKPKLAIDLATLTGAIIVALGKSYAGLYSNDDDLGNKLLEASKISGEKAWRMPLDEDYDKLIESRNADIKNSTGGRAAACTAAAFLQRFIKATPWAHIDLAGMAMDTPNNEINTSWGTGWGVRLLDRFVADNYEKASK